MATNRLLKGAALVLGFICAASPPAFASDETGNTAAPGAQTAFQENAADAQFTGLGNDILVLTNQARLVQLDFPADTIILGNPSIADVSMLDPQTAVVTGRAYGITNFIVRDDTGNIILDSQLIVTPDTLAQVTVQRAQNRTTLSCVAECEPVVRAGDSSAAFTSARSQASDADSFGRNALQSSGSGQF